MCFSTHIVTYEILQCGDLDKSIKTVQFATGHSRMIKELEKNFSQCVTRNLRTVGLILSNEFSSSGQVDFIDFQSMGDGQYK